KAHGDRALPALREAARTAPDAEMRRRAGRIVEALSARGQVRDRQPLQGRWRVVAWEENGVPYSPAVIDGDLVFTGEAGRWEFHRDGHTFDIPGAFTVGRAGDADTIDITGADSRNSVRGIYQLAGDDLTLCLAPRHRPEQFSSRGARLVVLRHQT